MKITLVSVSKEPTMRVELEYAIGVTRGELQESIAKYNKEHKAKVKIVKYNPPKTKAPSASITIEGTKRDVIFVAAAWYDTDPDIDQLSNDHDLNFVEV